MEKEGLLISTRFWANTQADILTGTGLPVSDEEMKTYLAIPDDVEIPQDFKKYMMFITNINSCVTGG